MMDDLLSQIEGDDSDNRRPVRKRRHSFRTSFVDFENSHDAFAVSDAKRVKPDAFLGFEGPGTSIDVDHLTPTIGNGDVHHNVDLLGNNSRPGTSVDTTFGIDLYDEPPLQLIGGICIYCGYPIVKPWDLVTHMVQQHDVTLIDLNCGEAGVINADLCCKHCGVIFTVLHDMYYHLIIGHIKILFGKPSTPENCRIDMITNDDKKLVLKVHVNKQRSGTRMKRPNNKSMFPLASVTPAASLYAPRTPKKIHPVEYSSSAMNSPSSAMTANMVRYRRIAQPSQVTQALKHVVPYTEKEESGFVSDEIIAEAEDQVRMHQKGFQCTKCFKIRQSREDAVAHVYRCHMTLRKFTCPHCPKNYDSAKNLQMHVNACHTQQRLYQCPGCPMKYKYPGDLKRHVTKNICQRYRNKGYSCPKCGNLWYHQSALASHQRQCDGGAGIVPNMPPMLM